MAQIPRINQGDRPSGVYTPTQDNSLARIAGALGDMSGAALETATAEEQANRRAHAAAFEEKQKIVDTSDAGVLGLQVQKRVSEITESLKAAYSDNPKAAIDSFIETTRPEVDVLMKQAPNGRVALMATRDAESAISSGLSRLQAWGISRDTERVKGNLAAFSFEAINKSVDYTSIPELMQGFAAVDNNPDFDAQWGSEAKAKRDEVKRKMTYAQMGRFSEKYPVTARDLLTSGNAFYAQHLSDTDYKALYEGTFQDANNFAAVDSFNTLVKYSKSKGTLISAALKGEARADVLNTERMRIEAEITAVDGEHELSFQAKNKKKESLRREILDLEAIKKLQARNLAPDYSGEDGIPAEILIARKKLADMGEGKQTLEAIKVYERMVMAAGANKQIRQARETVLLQEVGVAKPEAIANATTDTGNIFRRTNRQAGQLALEQEIQNGSNGLDKSAKIEAAATEQYVSDYLDEMQKTGTELSAERHVVLARRAYYKVIKSKAVGIPQGLR